MNQSTRWPAPGEQPKITWDAIPNNATLLGMWPIGLQGVAVKRNGKRWLPRTDRRKLGNVSMAEFLVCYADIAGVWHEVV